MRKLTAGGLVAFLLVCSLWATSPSGGGRTLIFSSFSNGGTELSSVRSGGRFNLSDILGRGTSAATERLENPSFHLYGGFRNIDRDLVAPRTLARTDSDTSSSSMFFVTWAGWDTSSTDGEGWGLYRFDIQWSKSSDPGVWHDWHTNTALTGDWFGPTEPAVVRMDTIYYFRTRGTDLAGNRGEYPTRAEDSTFFNPPVLAFTVRKTDHDSVWTVSGLTPGDTVDTRGNVIANTDNVFIVKNQGGDPIDVGLYSFSTTNWDLKAHPGRDAFSVRAVMNDDNTAPAPGFFNDSTAILANRSNINFARPTYYGGGGFNIAGASADSTERTENLWINVKAPTDVTRYGDYDNETIMIKIEARESIY